MSISRISAFASAGRCRMSPAMFLVNTVEPAPMKVMVVMGLASQTAISKAARTSRRV